MNQSSFKRLLTFGVAALALALMAGTAGAQILNGGFQTGDLTNWTPNGNVSVQDMTFGVTPPAGLTYQALLTTGPATGDTGPNDPIDAGTIESLVGLPAGTFTGAPQMYTNGSVLQQTFSVTAGQKLTFACDFLTNELTDGTGYPDGAYLVATGTAVGGTQSQLLATVTDAVNPSLSNGFASETGYQTQSLTFANTGSVTLSLLVMNAIDETTSSGLLVDNFALSTPTNGGNGGNAVPLPAAVCLFPLAMLVAGGYAARKRHALKA